MVPRDRLIVCYRWAIPLAGETPRLSGQMLGHVLQIVKSVNPIDG